MANRKRKNRISFYLDDKELEHLNQLGTAANISMSEVIRHLVNGTVPPLPPTDGERTMLRILRGIGTNLNQIAFQMNDGSYPRSAAFDKTMQSTQAAIEQFQSYLSERPAWVMRDAPAVETSRHIKPAAQPPQFSEEVKPAAAPKAEPIIAPTEPTPPSAGEIDDLLALFVDAGGV